MKNYDTLKKHCEKNSRFTANLVDEFLIDYAAGHHGLEKKMLKLFAGYTHVTEEFPEGLVEMMMSQFLTHRIFREEGLIHKFLKLPALRRFSQEELNFLKQLSNTPWRFSFSMITEEPHKDFHLMEDVFSGEEFLLYSPSITDLKSSGHTLLWFNLIGFNGSCWQSYGPIGAYNSFGLDDIFFFATELNPEIEEKEEVIASIKKNPLPYMMLLSGANYPLSYSKEDKMGYLMSEYDLDSCNTADLKKDFVTEYDKGVYRFSPQKWGEVPHLAQAYYDENLKIILFTAMTDRGFRGLVKAFNAHGYHFSDEAFLDINSSIVITAQDILGRKVMLNEYEDLFQVEHSKEENQALDAINSLMARVMPDVNAGRKPDIEGMAREAGVDPETATDLLNMLMEKTGKDFAEQTKIDFGEEGDGDLSKEADPKIRKESGSESELYERIYSRADVIRQLKPWKWMYEGDLFGVKIPGTDRIYFISIMGADGEFFAISAYKGYQGLYQFLEFREFVDSLPPETIFTIPHLMLSFMDREFLSDKHRASIKESGMSFRGKGNWPLLEDIEPAFVPVLPEGEALSDIPYLLDQVVEVAHRAKKNTDFLLANQEIYDQILIRTPPTGKKGASWKDVYETLDPENSKEHYNLTYRPQALDKVAQLPEASVVMQLDLVLLPNPVMERGKRGYFPFALLLVDKEREVVTGMQTLAPEPDLHSMYESVPQKVLEELLKLGYRPEKMEVRSELLYTLVQRAMTDAGVNLVQVEEMPQMDDFIGSLFSSLGRGA